MSATLFLIKKLADCQIVVNWFGFNLISYKMEKTIQNHIYAVEIVI